MVNDGFIPPDGGERVIRGAGQVVQVPVPVAVVHQDLQAIVKAVNDLRYTVVELTAAVRDGNHQRKEDSRESA